MRAELNILISGASTGIGRACAIQLAKKGHTVWAGVRTQEAVESLNRVHVRGLNPVRLDVTDAASIEACVGQVKKISGTLHALVNNAGIAVAGPIETVPLEQWRKQFETNFFGLIALTQKCLPLIRESKGRVVNMSSFSGRFAFPIFGPYAASKFAVEAMSDSLRRELRPLGAHVVLIEPGSIATPIWNKSIDQAAAEFQKSDPALREVYAPIVNRMLFLAKKSAERAAPVDLVVKTVVRALTARRPRARYTVGPGIGVAAALSDVLPDSWLDQVTS